MKPMIALTTVFCAAALPLLSAAAQTMPPATGEVSRASETPAERAQRLAADRAHSTAHANETPTQRAQRLAADRARSMAAKRAETPTAADAAADRERLANDRLHSKAHANETPEQRTKRLADDAARAEGRKQP